MHVLCVILKFAFCLVNAICVSTALPAQVQIEPGSPFRAVPFSSGPGEMPAFPGPDNPNFPAHFYTLANGPSGRELIAYDAAGSFSSVATVQLDFGVLDFGRRSTFGRLFVSEQGFPKGIAADGIYEFTPSYARIMFNAMGGGNPDPNDVEFPGGIFGDAVFVANPSDGSLDPNFNRTIVRLTTSGAFQSVLYHDVRGPFFMAASDGGSFGKFLYVSYYYSSAVDRIAADGTFAPFSDLRGPGGKIAFGVGGAFGHDLYGANAFGDLYRIDGAGSATRVATGIRNGVEFAFDTGSGDLIARDSGYVRLTGTAATCSSRNGTGVNPLVCTCTTFPVLGTRWRIAVATAPSTLRTLLYASASVRPPVLFAFGELLIAPPLFEIPGHETYSLVVPNDPRILGYQLSVQALRLNVVGTSLLLELTNAQDAVLGF